MPNKPKTTAHLPDAMPDIDKPTLLVVCSAHECKFIDVGNHTLLVSETMKSKDETFTDHEGSFRSPAAMGKGGMTSGTADLNPLEKNRLHEFARQVIGHVGHVIAVQGIEQWYLSAPGKLLTLLRKDLSVPLKKTLKQAEEGNFFKETLQQVLLRFRPDLQRAMKALREEENYSSKKHIPKKGK